MATATEYRSSSVTAESWEPLIEEGRETGQVHWLRREGEGGPLAGLWRISAEEGAELPYRANGIDNFHVIEGEAEMETAAGDRIALTAALTWGGVFGLLSSGLIGPIGWAVIGAVCGGLFAYYTEQPLSGTQVRRIGDGMRPDSSAIVVFMKSADEALLSTTAAYEPTTASLVALSGELSVRVLASPGGPAGVATGSGGQLPAAGKSSDRDTLLNMLLVRLPGQHTVREALPKLAATGETPDPGLPQVEVVLESDAQGALHVYSPNFGVRFSARSSLVSWGVLGLIFGAIDGLTGGGGILGFLGAGLITGVLWGAFGILAGALYGLFVGNILSGRQRKKFDGLVPPNSSLASLWADGDFTNEAIDRWVPAGS